jgi:hypothetical protein
MICEKRDVRIQQTQNQKSKKYRRDQEKLKDLVTHVSNVQHVEDMRRTQNTAHKAISQFAKTRERPTPFTSVVCSVLRTLQVFTSNGLLAFVSGFLATTSNVQ